MNRFWFGDEVDERRGELSVCCRGIGDQEIRLLKGVDAREWTGILLDLIVSRVV